MPAGAPGGGGFVSKDPSNRRHPEPTHRRRTFGPSWVNSDPNTPQPGDHHHDHPPQTSHRYRRLSDLHRRGLRPAAHAADVTLYGSIDTGILFQRVDTDRAGEDARNNVKMNSSSHTPNRWGLKGAEDLGNGLAVGFNLEGQFGSDDGSMMKGGLRRQPHGERRLHYDFRPWTLMTSAFWFQDAKGSNFLGHADMKDVWTKDAAGNADPATYKGYALQVGALIDAGGGTVKVNMGWMDAKVDKTYYGFDADQVLDAERFGVAAAYFYPLSKRTQVYAGAGWTKDKSSVVKGSDPSAWEAVSGLVVWF